MSLSTWIYINSVGTQVKSVASNSSGSLLLAGTLNSGFYLSTNSSTTWTKQTAPGTGVTNQKNNQ
jgi:hypothetical protein